MTRTDAVRRVSVGTTDGADTLEVAGEAEPPRAVGHLAGVRAYDVASDGVEAAGPDPDGEPLPVPGED
jgi:hypothetical protein